MPERAAKMEGRPRNWIAAAVIVALWLAIAAAAIHWALSRL